jgi:hypothetical protein
MGKEEKKRGYEKPKIVYEKKIETLALVCDSSWVGPGGTCCMNTACSKRST